MVGKNGATVHVAKRRRVKVRGWKNKKIHVGI